MALQYRGIPYPWRAARKGGIDCSGLIVGAAAGLGQRPPRSAAQLYDLGEPAAAGALRPGDRVFFASTYRPRTPQVSIHSTETGSRHAFHSTARVATGDLADLCSGGKRAGAGRLRLSIDPAVVGRESRTVAWTASSPGCARTICGSAAETARRQDDLGWSGPGTRAGRSAIHTEHRGRTLSRFSIVADGRREWE